MEKITSTFTVEEKQAIEKLDLFEKGMSEEFKQGIYSIKYFESFKPQVDKKVNSQIKEFNDIFIVGRGNRDEEIQIYEVYLKDSNKLLAIINENGNVIFQPPFEALNDIAKNVNLYELLKNKEAEIDYSRIPEISRCKASIDYLKEEEKEESIDKLIKKTDENGTKKEIQDEEDEINVNTEDASGKPVDLDIISPRKIKDPYIKQEFPELKKEGELYFAYSKAMGQFVCLQEVDGVYKLSDNIKPAKPTMRTVYEVGENGVPIEKKVPHALMPTTKKDFELSVSYGSHGSIELSKVRVTSDNERVAQDLTLQGERDDIRSSDESKALDTQSENQKLVDTLQSIENGENILYLTNGTTTVEAEIERLGMGVKGKEAAILEYITAFKNVEGLTVEEKMQNVEDYLYDLTPQHRHGPQGE